MCLAVPARITDITGGLLPVARVDQAGTESTCNLAYLPDATVGDYVLIQRGFAITTLDPQSAAASLDAFAELGLLADSDKETVDNVG